MSDIKVINKQYKDLDEYMEEWTKIDNTLTDNGMTWSSSLDETFESNYTEEAYCQYVTMSLVEFTQEQHTKAMQATTKIFDMLQEVTNKFYDLSEEHKITILDKLHFSKFNQDIILNAPKMNLFSYLCRLDLVWNNNDFKCLEFNADTPAGLVETGMINSVICDYHGKVNYNRAEKHLVDMWDNVRSELNIPKDEIIYFSSLDSYDEDKLNVQFNRIHSENSGKSKFIPLEEINVTYDGLFTPEGQKIKYWFKFYPVEYWEKEYNEENHFHLGEVLKELIKSGDLVVINPISAFFVQNKLFYEMLWNLTYDNFLNISNQSLDIIEQYLLPTFKSKKEAQKYLTDYVEKPIFGREGNCVTIFKNGEIEFEDVEHGETFYYGSQDMIYQKFIQMPLVQIETWDGPYEGYMLTGSYLIGGKASGLYNRVGHEVTGNLSLFSAFTIQEEN